MLYYSRLLAVLILCQLNSLSFLLEPARVVLEAKFGFISHLEVGEFAVQGPNDGTVGTVDLVNGASVACENEVVTLGILVS